jgi:hypothetical protein
MDVRCYTEGQFVMFEYVSGFTDTDLRVWRGFFMSGPSAILQVDTCRGLMIWPHHSSRSFFLRILVCMPIFFPYCSVNNSPTDSDPEIFDPSVLPKSTLDAIEADSFWCLSRLLDGIQDNYIFAQPGIVRSVKRMAELVARIDGECVNTVYLSCSQTRQLLYMLIWCRKTWNLCNSHLGG